MPAVGWSAGRRGARVLAGIVLVIALSSIVGDPAARAQTGQAAAPAPGEIAGTLPASGGYAGVVWGGGSLTTSMSRVSG